MNILFLSDIVPYPPNTGIKIRTFNIIKQLSKLNRIYLLSFNHKVMINDSNTMLDCKKKLEEYCEKVYIFEIPSDKNKIFYYFSLFKNLFQFSPYRVCRYYTKDCIQKIKEINSRVNLDLVHLDKTEFFYYTQFTQKIPAIATNHNVESELMKHRIFYEINILRRLFAFLQFIKTKHFEKIALNKVSGYITCTDVDYSHFKNRMGIKTKHETIHNGVDIKFYKAKGLTEENYILIIGAQTKEATANYNATIYFVKNIWPIICKYNDSIKLKIVGRNPDKTIIELEKDKRISVLGFVEDERDVIEKSMALLVPLQIGGGSRLKILTAMSMGKVVISTSKGAEGINCKHNNNIIIANTTQEFAKQIIAVVSNENIRKQIGNEARKLVIDLYDWEKIGLRINQFYFKELSNG